MKIQRVVEQVAETDEERKEREERQQQRNDRRNGDRQHQARKQTGPRRVASVSDGVAAGEAEYEGTEPRRGKFSFNDGTFMQLEGYSLIRAKCNNFIV